MSAPADAGWLLGVEEPQNEAWLAPCYGSAAGGRKESLAPNPVLLHARRAAATSSARFPSMPPATLVGGLPSGVSNLLPSEPAADATP